MSSLDAQISHIQSNSGYNFFSSSTAADRASLSQTPLSFTEQGSAKLIMESLTPSQRQTLIDGRLSHEIDTDNNNNNNHNHNHNHNHNNNYIRTHQNYPVRAGAGLVNARIKSCEDKCILTCFHENQTRPEEFMKCSSQCHDQCRL
jgi:hypothetical protein